MPLVCVLTAGCAAMALPAANQEALLLAAHQNYQHRYLDASPEQRREMLRETGVAVDNGDTRARVRQALLLSAPDADADSLAEAIRIYDRLADDDDLTSGEKRAVRVWRRNAEMRLKLKLENDRLRSEIHRIQQQLELARRQIEQLTRIEQDLQAEDNAGGER